MDTEETILLLAATPATVYREYLYRPGSPLARVIDDRFEVIARPGERIGQLLREGDVLLEVTLGSTSPGRCVPLAAHDIGLIGSRAGLAPGRLVLRARRRLEMSEPLSVEPVVDTKEVGPDVVHRRRMVAAPGGRRYS